MKAFVVGATMVASALLGSSGSALSADRWGLLSPAQTREYHACLFEAWIQHYCHWNSPAYAQCVIANGGGRYPLDGRLFTEDYCWSTAQGLGPR